MRILGDGYVRNEALLLAIEVDEDEQAEHEEAGDTIPTEGSSSTVVGDKHAANNGAAAATQPMMDALEHTLRRGAQVLGRIVSNVWARGGPDGGMRDALHQLEGQYHPGISEIRDVQKTQHISDQAQAQDLDMTNLGDQTEAKEIGKDLGHMIDHWGDTEERGRAAIILQVPEQEGKDQTNAEAHEPSDKQKRCGL